MNERQQISKRVDVVIMIRELVEDAMKRNPHMSSHAVLELMLEGIQEDCLDGWEPGEEIERMPHDFKDNPWN